MMKNILVDKDRKLIDIFNPTGEKFYSSEKNAIYI